MADQASQAEHYDEDTLQTPLRINAVLHSLQKHRTQLRVVFRGELEDCISLILRVDAEDNCFYLDEFVPRTAHDKALEHRHFSIFARHGGAQVIMRNLVVSAAGESGGNAYYRVQTPDSIRYVQRRGAFRVEVPHAIGASVQLANKQRSTRIGGTLVDLSGTGCRLVMDHEIQPPLQSGERFDYCLLDVPGREPLELSAVVRFLTWDRQHEFEDIGLEFRDASNAQDRAIWSLVNALQRKVRKFEMENEGNW